MDHRRWGVVVDRWGSVINSFRRYHNHWTRTVVFEVVLVVMLVVVVPVMARAALMVVIVIPARPGRRGNDKGRKRGNSEHGLLKHGEFLFEQTRRLNTIIAPELVARVQDM